MNPKFSQISVLMLTLLGLTLHAHAVVVNWSASFHGAHEDSRGQALDAEFTFELGAFDEGFLPTAANTGEWVRHWTALDSAVYDEASGRFASAADTRASSLPAGTKMFVWGYDQRPARGDAEWVLFSSADWHWPGALEGSESPSLVWTVADASEPTLGTLNAAAAELRMANVVATSAGVSPAAWLEEHFEEEAGQIEVAGWNADPDADGLANLLEYAFGFDPNVGDADGGTVQAWRREDDGLFLRIQAPHNPLSHIRVRVEKSDGLREWVWDEQAIRQNGEEAGGMLIFDSPLQPGPTPSFRRLRVDLEEEAGE